MCPKSFDEKNQKYYHQILENDCFTPRGNNKENLLNLVASCNRPTRVVKIHSFSSSRVLNGQ